MRARRFKLPSPVKETRPNNHYQAPGGSIVGSQRGWRARWENQPLCAACVANFPYRCNFAFLLRAGKGHGGTCEPHPYQVRRNVPRDTCIGTVRECA